MKKANSASLPTDIVIKDITYKVSMARVLPASGTPDPRVPTYHVSTSQLSQKTGALVDQGANGGIASTDCRVVEQDAMPKSTRKNVNIKGINNHVMEQHTIMMAGAVAHSNCGPIILIMHEFTHTGKGMSILLSAQMEWYKVDVDDKSIKVGGKQRLAMLGSFVIPLDIHRGLAYLDMHPFTEQEWNELQYVKLTHENVWDPQVLVYFHMDDSAFPSENKENQGCWMGISENVGPFMTFKVLTNDTLKVIHQSNIHSACDPTAKNLCLDLLNEDFPNIVKSLRQQSGQGVYSPASDHGEMDAHMQNLNDENATPMNVSNTSTPPMAVVDPQDLVGCTFLMDEYDDGQCFRAEIVESIRDHESDQVPFLEYKDICNDVHKAFPNHASLVDSIKSGLATRIAKDLRKDDNDDNLLDLDS